jgi:small-conductance mechanosensitive channel
MAQLTLPSDTSDSPVAWLAVTVLVAAVGALILAVLIGLVFRRLGRRWPVAVEASRRGRLPLRLLLVLIAVRQVISATTAIDAWQDTIVTVLQLGILAVCGWLLAVLAYVLEDLMLARFRMDVADNLRARRGRTQVILLRRLTVAAIVVLVVASMLLTLPGARQAGATILASAGVIGIVAGLAAQSSLSNLFAGLQIAFTDAVRVDDVVVVEGEWGRIEEITLTYVVVHLWDDRRLIMPSTYFTGTPFQNWTRKDSAVLGAVEIDLDWRVPVDQLRVELDRALRASSLWDERTGVLQVTDAVGGHVRVRVLVSGVDGPTVFDLRCEIREALVTYLQREHPEALPALRVEFPTGSTSHDHRDGRAGAELVAAPTGGHRESEATHSQGLFTGSFQAEQRARGFKGPGDTTDGHPPVSGRPNPRPSPDPTR